MYAKGMDEEEAAEWLEGVLVRQRRRSNGTRHERKSKAKAAAARRATA